ncbi:unnamed protein product [Sphenostylis stenocarpa]|uniref:Uncharacterized protein n=1 Tax=Sphenostylis stenocarpa TaxID=92480 RepID=A0AA86VMT1_9FABA|nr:unnamed protein product [Sphenostylis stenocarpa]
MSKLVLLKKNVLDSLKLDKAKKKIRRNWCTDGGDEENDRRSGVGRGRREAEAGLVRHRQRQSGEVRVIRLSSLLPLDTEK